MKCLPLLLPLLVFAAPATPAWSAPKIPLPTVGRAEGANLEKGIFPPVYTFTLEYPKQGDILQIGPRKVRVAKIVSREPIPNAGRPIGWVEFATMDGEAKEQEDTVK